MRLPYAEDYLNATVKAGSTSDAAKAAWNNVGYKKVDDETIEVEFRYACDTFNALYRLSGSLLAPINEEFYTLVTTLDPAGVLDSESFDPTRYAKLVVDGTTGINLSPADTVLSCGPYTVKSYETGTGTDNQIVFVKNEDWVDTVSEKAETGYDIYQIPGVLYNVKASLSQDAMANYNEFKAGKVDSSGIPAAALEAESGEKPYKHFSEGSSVWKMQVNSLTQEEWNSIFKAGGEVLKDYQTENEADYYQCKPIMSNDDFINGVYTSINRAELAKAMGADIGDSFFSDAYEIDPVKHVIYNDTAAHADAVKDFYPETNGYNLEAAKALFSRAIDAELAAGHYKAGTPENPTEIHVQFAYQMEAQKTEEGEMEAKYVQDAFNAVGLAKGVKLVIDLFAPTNWSDIYYNMRLVGKFDFAFASVSGGTLDPLNFMNTLCSNSRSTFTLSWGAHTNEVDGDIIYDGKALSYDALYDALVLGEAEIADGKLVY